MAPLTSKKNYLALFGERTYLLIRAESWALAYGEAIVQSIERGKLRFIEYLPEVVAK